MTVIYIHSYHSSFSFTDNSGHPITYDLEVTATDAEGAMSICYITIDVTLTNDHDPIWDTAGGTTFQVSEWNVASTLADIMVGLCVVHQVYFYQY